MTSLLRRQITLAGLLAASGCAATAPATEERTKVKTMSQDATPKRTHCLGRYLIDLHSDVKVDASFVFVKGIVRTLNNISQSSFEQIVSTREAKLKTSQHGNGDSMLVARSDLGAGKVVIQSLKSSTSKAFHLNETFVYLADKKILFTQADESNASAQAQSLNISTLMANSFRHRETNEIPSGIGFCVNFGLLAANKLNNEEVKASFKFKPYPTVSVYFTSYVTGNPDAELLNRLGGIPASLAAAAAGMTTLRKGNRDLGPVKGQELLVRAREEGKRSYEFLWESQGRANSIEFPFLSLKLTTSAETNEKGQVVDAPFKTDEEALQFWDGILHTLRLRPGAV